jgi:hypothetical protein
MSITQFYNGLDTLKGTKRAYLGKFSELVKYSYELFLSQWSIRPNSQSIDFPYFITLHKNGGLSYRETVKLEKEVILYFSGVSDN